MDFSRTGDWSKLTNLHPHLWGDASMVFGDASKIYGRIKCNPEVVHGSELILRGDLSGLEGCITQLIGDVTHLRGDTTGLIGDVSNLRGLLDGLRGFVHDLRGDISNIKGFAGHIRGDVTNLRGNITRLKGDLSNIHGTLNGLWGDVTEIQGDITKLYGDASRLKGDVSGYVGHTSKYEISSRPKREPKIKIRRCRKCEGGGRMTCPRCHGKGYEGKNRYNPCDDCLGERKVECSFCYGLGKHYDDPEERTASDSSTSSATPVTSTPTSSTTTPKDFAIGCAAVVALVPGAIAGMISAGFLVAAAQGALTSELSILGAISLLLLLIALWRLLKRSPIAAMFLLAYAFFGLMEISRPPRQPAKVEPHCFNAAPSTSLPA